MSHNAFKRRHCRNKSESKSESGFIGQVSLHKQGILLGKVTLSVLTQNIHYNTIQNKQCNSATVQQCNGLRSLRKYIPGGLIWNRCLLTADAESNRHTLTSYKTHSRKNIFHIPQLGHGVPFEG